MRSVLAITFFTSLGLCCPALASAQETSSSSRPTYVPGSAGYAQRDRAVQGGQFLHGDTPDAKAIAKARSAGLRTDGLYVRKSKPSYSDYLRFCADGSVVGAVSSGNPQQVWRWLACDPVNPRHSHGVIAMDGEQLSFTLHMPVGEIDYVGTIKGDTQDEEATLTLDVTTHVSFAPNFGTTNERSYSFVPLD